MNRKNSKTAISSDFIVLLEFELMLLAAVQAR